MFFIKKKSRELRLVCEYRELQNIKIEDRIPLPLVEDTMEQVSGATVLHLDEVPNYNKK